MADVDELLAAWAGVSPAEDTAWAVARPGPSPDAVAARLASAPQWFLDAIAEPKRRRKAQPDLPAFQPVRRDFAFLADAATPAEALLRAARGAFARVPDADRLAFLAWLDRVVAAG